MALIENPSEMRMYNDILVMADKELEDMIVTKKLVLHKNTSFSKNTSKRIFGKVVAIPYKIRPTRIHQTNSIYPKAHQSFSGDIIQLQVHAYQKAIRRKLQEKELKIYMDKYRSSPWTPEFTRNDDQDISCVPGDVAWFHFLGLDEKSYMGQDEKNNRYYRIPFETIFCFTRGEEVTMVNGYVQVEPYWSKDFKEIDVDGVKVMGKMRGNLVVQLKDKPELQTGTVVCKGNDFGSDSRPTLGAGDVILYRKGSEFHNTIKGKESMLMRQWNIIAKQVDGKFMPVGNYVMLRINKIPEKKIIHMDMIKRDVEGLMQNEIQFKKELSDLIEEIGHVLAIGENCEHAHVGTDVFFNVNAEVFNIADVIFIKEGDVIAEINQ